MASRGALEETRKSPVETSKETSKTSTKGVSNASETKTSSKGISRLENSPERKETAVVLFRPEARLNPDVLELIFRHLNFKELLAAELVGNQISLNNAKKKLAGVQAVERGGGQQEVVQAARQEDLLQQDQLRLLKEHLPEAAQRCQKGKI